MHGLRHKEACPVDKYPLSLCLCHSNYNTSWKYYVFAVWGPFSIPCAKKLIRAFLERVYVWGEGGEGRGGGRHKVFIEAYFEC